MGQLHYMRQTNPPKKKDLKAAYCHMGVADSCFEIFFLGGFVCACSVVVAFAHTKEHLFLTL